MTGTLTYKFTIALDQRSIFRRCADFFAAVFQVGYDNETYEKNYISVVEKYETLIERICFGYARSVADFEDLKQDSLLNLWESMPKFRGSCSMKTWVYRITLNSCVTSLRKISRSINTVLLTELYDTIDYDAERKTMLSEVHESIARLNPIDKAIIMLWLEDESYEDIAGIMGLTRANVATRLHRAKEKLRISIEI